MLQRLGFTALGVLALSGVLTSSRVEANTVPPRCPATPVHAPRPRDCTITSLPESSTTTPPPEDGTHKPGLYRGSGRNLRDKQRDATKPYYPPDRGAPDNTVGSGTR